MSKALRSWRRRKDGRDGTDADVRPIEEKLRDIEFRLSELEKRPVALTPVNDQQAIPAAIGKLLERIEELENRPVDITPSDVSNETIKDLADAVTEAGEAALRFTKNAAVLVKRMDAAEARSAQVEELAVGLEKALTELEGQVATMPDEILQEFRQARREQKEGVS